MLGGRCTDPDHGRPGTRPGRLVERVRGRALRSRATNALRIACRRLVGISQAAGVALADLDIKVITAPTAQRRGLVVGHCVAFQQFSM